MVEALEGQVGKAAVLALADAILNARVAAVSQIQPRGVVAALVGEEDRQAVAVVVGEALLVAVLELGAAGDQPRAVGPRRQVDAVGDLDDLGVLALAAVGADRALPCGFGHACDRVAHALVEIEPE